jgi:hypothetical protein
MNVSRRRKTFLSLFPTPKFLLLSTAGIVITDNNTKFVQLSKNILGSGFKLVHYSKVDNPKDAVAYGLINSPDKLAPILKDFAARFNVRYVHATLPEEKAYLFTTTIDSIPSEGLQDAVAFIVEENVPLSLTEAVFDFEVVSEDPVAKKIKLTVSVLPKSVVNSYVAVFESAGITPISFDIESQAIARAVVPHTDMRTQLIINLGEKKTGFYVIEEGVVQFSATIAYGAGEESSLSDLNNLKAEIERVLVFWNARIDIGNAKQKVEKILLCGLVASKKDFIEKLMSESKIEYSLADVWVNALAHPIHMTEKEHDESLYYASAIGLVLPRNK